MLFSLYAILSNKNIHMIVHNVMIFVRKSKISKRYSSKVMITLLCATYSLVTNVAINLQVKRFYVSTYDG